MAQDISVPIQDLYPESVSYCYGCGRLNEHGLQIKSYADGEETVCHFTPRPYHTAVPGYVYGGLIASLIDCHATGTAAIAAYRAEDREPGTEPPIRFVTASLKVDYHRPTPLGPVLELRGRAREVRGRKVWLDIELSAEGQVCARGEVLCVRIPEEMWK
ncbi:MAG: PaaI family thioesterase [Nitrososphaerales archaeon]